MIVRTSFEVATGVSDIRAKYNMVKEIISCALLDVEFQLFGCFCVHGTKERGPRSPIRAIEGQDATDRFVSTRSQPRNRKK